MEIILDMKFLKRRKKKKKKCQSTVTLIPFFLIQLGNQACISTEMVENEAKKRFTYSNNTR